MNSSDSDDPLLDALRGLRDYDVSGVRARRLRERCHTTLQRHALATPAPGVRDLSRSQRTIRVLAGAWCGVYLFETIRLVAAVYGRG